MKRFLCLLLIVVLFLGPTGCTALSVRTASDFLRLEQTEAQPERAFHTELRFSELPESGIDASLEAARTRELLFRIQKGELSGERAQQALDARSEAYERLETDASIAYVRYCLDVTNEENRNAYDVLIARMNAIECNLTDAAILLSKDPALSDRYDAETREALERADALSDSAILSLAERERALVGKYEALSETLTVSYLGKEWTGDRILSDPSLTEEDFLTLYETYLERFNREAGGIFLDLIGVRNEIAKTLGFDSYADYRYACYDRDYSPENAKMLAASVRTWIVPAFTQMREDFYAAVGQVYGIVLDQETTMRRIGEAVVSILPELSEPWTYMMSHEMYDLGSDTKRMPGSFTTWFRAFGAPFLFSAWTNGFEMPSTITHEFGHFSSYFLNGDALKNGNSLDLAEIDSQGLELLSVLRYDTLYGDLSDAAQTVQLFYALYALIDGCMEDAFQQFAYGQDGMTLERLNAEYGRLSEAYGLSALGIEPRSWTQIQHTFQSPFYYISYAASMSAALELYLKGRRDLDTARNAYRAILLRDGGARFQKTLAIAGLSNPFEAETIRKTANELGSVRRNKTNE